MSFSPVAVSEGGAKSLQSCDVSGELENPENTEDSENLGCLGDVLEGVLWREQVEKNRDEEGEDPHQVDHVQERDQEFKLEMMSSLLKLFWRVFYYSFNEINPFNKKSTLLKWEGEKFPFFILIRNKYFLIAWS